MDFDKAAFALSDYCRDNMVLRVLQPMGPVILYASTLVFLLGQFVNTGGLGTLAQYGFYLGLVLSAANSDYGNIAVNLKARAIVYAWLALYSLLFTKTHFINTPALISLAVLGFFSHLAGNKYKSRKV